MTFTNQRKLTIVARNKIRRLTEHCDAACPGWAVFETNQGGEVQACDACWNGIANRLTDEEAAALPEARKLLLAEYEHLSPWQRSLGFPGLPKLTKAEEVQLARELAAGRRYMAKRGAA